MSLFTRASSRHCLLFCKHMKAPECCGAALLKGYSSDIWRSDQTAMRKNICLGKKQFIVSKSVPLQANPRCWCPRAYFAKKSRCESRHTDWKAQNFVRIAIIVFTLFTWKSWSCFSPLQQNIFKLVVQNDATRTTLFFRLKAREFTICKIRQELQFR